MTIEIDRNIQEPFQLNTGGSESEEDSEESFTDGDEEDIENISPVHGDLELMVAVRPLMQHNLSSNSKINISTPNKRTIEQNVLVPKNLISPIKRPFVTGISSGAPLAKKLSISSIASSISSSLPNSPNQRILSQSAGSSCKLQSAIKRVQTNLSQSCFADLRAIRGDDVDSDLTCLNWLQEGNLLNGFTPGKKSDNDKKDEGDEKENENSDQHSSENSDLRLSLSDPLNAISEVDKSLRKPAYSFSTLIFMAIENAKDKRLPVKEIYQWIQDNFPYFQKAPIGWKNSVRHNLSLNKSFKKVDKEKCVGKGSLWTIDHEARAGLVQQLRKTATYHSYPYSRLPYPHRYYTKDRSLCKRDATGRFLPNHDDAEFDVAATMCSLSSPAALSRSHPGSAKCSPDDQKSSVELLKIWRTYIEPRDDSSRSSSCPSSPNEESFKPIKTKYSIEDFLEEVHNKLSFKSKGNNNSTKKARGNLNTSLDEDYEFYNSEDESSDEEDDEMNENMRKLVEKEKDDGLGDSGYSEEGSLRSVAVFDHSYSKSIQSLCRPQSRRESKGVAALLSLANAASKELESLCKESVKMVTDTSSVHKANTEKPKDLKLNNTSSLEGAVKT